MCSGGDIVTADILPKLQVASIHTGRGTLVINEVASSQLAIDGQIEQCQVTQMIGPFQADAYCQDFLQF